MQVSDSMIFAEIGTDMEAESEREKYTNYV